MKTYEFDVKVSAFLVPAENLILLGLRHTGLLHYPGFKNFLIKSWSKQECIITVELVAISDPPDPRRNMSPYSPYCVNGYSEQEMGIMEKIQKFFSPTAIVIMWDKMSMTGFPSD